MLFQVAVDHEWSFSQGDSYVIDMDLFISRQRSLTKETIADFKNLTGTFGNFVNEIHFLRTLYLWHKLKSFNMETTCRRSSGCCR